jgi:hypothetical protein
MADKSWCSIEVSGKKVKIDREDLERVSERKWRITAGTTGRERVVTSIRGPTGSRTITLGAFLMHPPKAKQVYPRRFNEGFDYRKSNLVVCTLKERQRLLPKKRTKTSSIYRGVSFLTSAGTWRAAIEVEGESINLGNFESDAAAALAYNKAARKYFGRLAYQNEIRKTDPSRRR